MSDYSEAPSQESLDRTEQAHHLTGTTNMLGRSRAALNAALVMHLLTAVTVLRSYLLTEDVNLPNHCSLATAAQASQVSREHCL